ncbi:hypothetical protein SAMN04488012_103259 [Palleronia salina]|uniref:Uncharacterized protein n=1 Tax=Palleronia salina TaxID=313368 RepID=A0A1M6EXM6_9RHOB|nr:hypothetical protein [Palleronia salina]SHI90198.1 hypothetical protein SAMN04488012_103259 [Palleronia salina]
MPLPTTNRFARDEFGGASLDWKVLTALICGVGIAVGATVYDGAEAPSEDIQATLSDESLPDQIFPGRAID